MSDRMTSVNLPGVSGAGWADYGRKEPSEMIAALRRYARQEIAWAQKVLAADDADFRVETYTGVHVQRNREVLQQGVARKESPLDKPDMQPTVTKAKPCPFCGGDAVTTPYRSVNHPLWSIGCENEDSCGFKADCFHSEAEAITAWNTRTTPDAELVEALREIARGKYDGLEVTHYTARQCREVARKALSLYGGEKP